MAFIQHIKFVQMHFQKRLIMKMNAEIQFHVYGSDSRMIEKKICSFHKKIPLQFNDTALY